MNFKETLKLHLKEYNNKSRQIHWIFNLLLKHLLTADAHTYLPLIYLTILFDQCTLRGRLGSSHISYMAPNLWKCILNARFVPATACSIYRFVCFFGSTWHWHIGQKPHGNITLWSLLLSVTTLKSRCRGLDCGGMMRTIAQITFTVSWHEWVDRQAITLHRVIPIAFSA